MSSNSEERVTRELRLIDVERAHSFVKPELTWGQAQAKLEELSEQLQEIEHELGYLSLSLVPGSRRDRSARARVTTNIDRLERVVRDLNDLLERKKPR